MVGAGLTPALVTGEAGDHKGLCWRMTVAVQSSARVPARDTPTMTRMGLPRRVMVGAGLAPALVTASVAGARYRQRHPSLVPDIT